MSEPLCVRFRLCLFVITRDGSADRTGTLGAATEEEGTEEGTEEDTEEGTEEGIEEGIEEGKEDAEDEEEEEEDDDFFEESN